MGDAHAKDADCHDHEAHAEGGRAERAPHAHAHHDALGHGMGSARRLGVSLTVALLIMAAELVGGWISGSLALISDAGHMLTDAAALGLALLAVRFGALPPDAKRTYGFRRLEVLAAQINVVTLVLISGWIVWESVDRLRHPHPPIALGAMALVAGIGLVGNLVIMRWLHGDHSLNTRSAFLHVLGDAVASLAVLIGAGAMAVAPGALWVDPVLSLFIALLILWGVIRLIVEISDILMEAVPRHLDVDEIAHAMEGADEGVIAVHDLHVWIISSGLYALSAHLVIGVETMGRNDDILTHVKSCLRQRFGIGHTTLQIESVRYVHVDDAYRHC